MKAVNEATRWNYQGSQTTKMIERGGEDRKNAWAVMVKLVLQDNIECKIC